MLRNRFGIPGVISVIALVFAMLGGAYAASNSGGGVSTASKTKVKKVKGPRGPRGATGPTGPTGAVGPVGANGKDGAPGAAGAPGTSVTNEVEPPATANCGGRGGAKFKVGSGSVTFACTGEKGATGDQGPIGSPWTAGGTLPPGATETGTFAGLGRPAVKNESEETIAGGVMAALTFPIPLPAPIEDPEKIKKIDFGEPVPTECDGGTPAAPKASPGYLCIYNGPLSKSPLGVTFSPAGQPVKVGTTGAAMLANSESFFFGSFAVTACGEGFPCP